MPNHVRNVLKMEGIETLPIFRTEYNEWEKKNEVSLDFDKLIPMPARLNVDSGSEDTYIIYYLTDRCTMPLRDLPEDAKQIIRKHVTNMICGDDWPEEVFKRALSFTHGCTDEEKEEYYQKGKTYVWNILEYGWPTWYEWRRDKWGTKWNAYDCVIEKDQITFSTAWSSPEPVINKLAEMYSESHIEHIWADEDMGRNSGYREYFNHQWKGDYDDTDQEAYEHYMETWGSSNCLYKDSDGLWQRRSCETCHRCD